MRSVLHGRDFGTEVGSEEGVKLLPICTGQTLKCSSGKSQEVFEGVKSVEWTFGYRRMKT